MAQPSLVDRLVAQVEARANGVRPRRAHILVGALSNISPTSLRRHFAIAVEGSALANVELVFHVAGDPLSPDALTVRVVDVEADVAA